MKWPAFKAAPGSLEAIREEIKHNKLNDGPAPKDDVQHLPKPSWQQAAWPLNDNSQPPRRRNWPLDDDSN
ncbi:hypothetical protein COHA_000594 [Chlorella ohadii]|uniref:Uncharacterized protein n=1 Tax=Chlorella ohadii TaxID=2649997 RepID=A0AAD5DXJ2_9CHLO|nr:hypothetical protein COHA_000594 [Chlorella ohadii]